MKFSISEKKMREVLGAAYRLENYVEGRDYVRHKIRVGTRVAFRSDILDGHVAAVSDDTPAPAQLPERSEEPVAANDKLDGEAVVTRKYPNPRYVETTVGKVFVGQKTPKVGQTINVKNGVMVVKATVGTV